jgi:hypothetical protein
MTQGITTLVCSLGAGTVRPLITFDLLVVMTMIAPVCACRLCPGLHCRAQGLCGCLQPPLRLPTAATHSFTVRTPVAYA